ncbi:SDR family oxidoreductase [Streptomyces sp. ME08-AFT2]|nr:SDR family oxidoreductase [Streptomyces sp. ME08-AFT2]MDX3309014.1 SDR family oxidoreductase [Streptomyces sp. ME08-AFT2]
MTMLEGARERRVRTGGIELCVVELGDPRRPTVVLVHGYPDSKEVWSAVAARLAGRFHVVLYDVRGHGRSEAPKPLRGGFTLEKLTDDFLAVADAVSPDGPVHLVGHDWGSVQAWEFVTVRRTEGRIASFTSLSGPSLDHFGHWIATRVNKPTPRRVGQLLGQGAKSWYVYLLHTPVLPELAWRGPLGKRWPGILRRVEKVPADACPTPSLPSDAANGAWLYRDNVRTRLRRPRADAHAHVPVQLITPLGDRFLSERLYDELEDWVPRLTRRTLPAGHWVPRTRPDRLASWIDDFVSSVEKERDENPASDAGSSAASAIGSSAGSAAGGSGSGVETVRTTRRGGGRSGRARAVADRYAERFGGQLVLVTGAGSGIGRATALAFAEAGARVIVVDRDADSAARTAELSRRVGAFDAWAEAVDVSDEQAMEKLAAKVHTDHGVLDVLVNNAGIGMAGSFFDTTSDDWRRVLDVNLWGVIHGCRLFGRAMAERGQGGHIVNIASAAAFQPSRTLPAYSTSKAAVLMLSECLRAELAGRDIGVTAICPGLVNTGITATATCVGVDAEDERRRQKRAARLYGMRNYPPEKVAQAILRAVVQDDAMVTVTPEAKTAHVLSRFLPRALRALARVSPPV